MTKGTRKYFFGYSPVKLSDGTVKGAGILQHKTKNAYEYLGLRRPATSGALKA
jgi:hypothetical protein